MPGSDSTIQPAQLDGSTTGPAVRLRVARLNGSGRSVGGRVDPDAMNCEPARRVSEADQQLDLLGEALARVLAVWWSRRSLATDSDSHLLYRESTTTATRNEMV
jgi:hypothetical protein